MPMRPPDSSHAPAARTGAPSAPGSAKIGNYRWTICALLFLAATVNYIDRQVIGILKPTLQETFGWSEVNYADIVFYFQLAYAIGLVFVGRVIDALGTKWGFSIALAFWSAAAMAHAGVRSVAGFAAARFALGLGEAGSFPASIKTVAEWFPKRERALATGLFNSGTNVGAIVVPLLVPALTLTFGWQAAFIVTGALGLLWLVLWIPLYSVPEKSRRVSAAELAHIQSDPPDPVTPLPWRAVLGHRQAWAFAAGKFLTDPIWWLYLFWVPDFLHRNYGINLQTIGLPLVVAYTGATIGSITFIKRGWTLNAARKTAMLICAVAVVPMVFASRIQNLWVAVAFLGLAMAAHQGWSANLFTTTSDMFPRRAVASVTGFGGMAGAVGGMLIAKITGYLLEVTGSYLVVFIIAGTIYLFALLVFQLLAPRIEPVKVSADGDK